MFNQLVSEYKQPIYHGYLTAKFSGRDNPSPYPEMNAYNDYIERMAFFGGFFKGVQERHLGIISGQWIKIGGVYQEIPEGTSIEDWKGCEEIVRMPCNLSRISSKG